MFAEITLSKGSSVAPFASLALYSSDRTASSPLTAYFASLTWGFMLLMFRLRRLFVVDIVRCGICNHLLPDDKEFFGLSGRKTGQMPWYILCNEAYKFFKKKEENIGLSDNCIWHDPTTYHTEAWMWADFGNTSV